jgi:hypothetical protein
VIKDLQSELATEGVLNLTPSTGQPLAISYDGRNDHPHEAADFDEELVLALIISISTYKGLESENEGEEDSLLHC